MGGVRLEVGEEFSTAGVTVTEAHIVSFAGVTGDFNPVHMSEEYASKTIFKRRVAHGMLTLSLALGMLTGIDAFEGTILYGFDKVRFTKPVFPGDTVRARFKVAEKGEKAGMTLLKLKLEVENQRGELVLAAEVLVLCREQLTHHRSP
ncbi:MAG: dehydratase [Thermoproteota archaeon]|nr:MAG: dehydratase [Candidatus Korarchaeota archaeon]RLG53548.1 MAG: dehydratase [Candidatus Korarchaeota archaeon]